MANVEPEAPQGDAQQAPQGPAPPQAQNVAEIILTELKNLRVRQDQLAAHMAKLAEVKVPQGNQVPAQGGTDLWSMLSKGLDAYKEFTKSETGGGGPPGSSFFFDLYRKAHENFDQKVFLPGLTRMAGLEVSPNGHARIEP